MLSELEIFRQAVGSSNDYETEKVIEKILRSDLRKYLITNSNNRIPPCGAPRPDQSQTYAWFSPGLNVTQEGGGGGRWREEKDNF